MFRKSDFFIILAVMISFFISAYLWFVVHDREQAIYTAIWIPYQHIKCVDFKSIL